MHGPVVRPEATDAEMHRVRLRAIGLIVSAYLAFSALDATAKYLGALFDPLMITWARYVSHLGLALAVLAPVASPTALLSTRRPALQGFRAVMLFGSTAFNFAAVQYLQLSQTVAIQFAAPFLVALLAGPMLGESVGRQRWAAILVGFVGVLVVVRPGTASFEPAMLLSVAGAICYAFYNVTTRQLAGTDSAAAMLVLSALVPVVGMVPLVPLVWTWPDSPWIWILLGLTGAYGGLGHYLLIRAYGLAPAPILAPFQYSQIVWMVALGFLVFGDVPDRWTLLGAAIVVASGLLLLYRERTAGAGT